MEPKKKSAQSIHKELFWFEAPVSPSALCRLASFAATRILLTWIAGRYDDRANNCDQKKDAQAVHPKKLQPRRHCLSDRLRLDKVRSCRERRRLDERTTSRTCVCLVSQLFPGSSGALVAAFNEHSEECVILKGSALVPGIGSGRHAWSIAMDNPRGYNGARVKQSNNRREKTESETGTRARNVRAECNGLAAGTCVIVWASTEGLFGHMAVIKGDWDIADIKKRGFMCRAYKLMCHIKEPTNYFYGLLRLVL